MPTKKQTVQKKTYELVRKYVVMNLEITGEDDRSQDFIEEVYHSQALIDLKNTSMTRLMKDPKVVKAFRAYLNSAIDTFQCLEEELIIESDRLGCQELLALDDPGSGHIGP